MDNTLLQLIDKVLNARIDVHSYFEEYDPTRKLSLNFSSFKVVLERLCNDIGFRLRAEQIS